VTENRGPAAARNLGARLASAPYLAYLDSDNTWHTEFLSTMLNAIESQPTNVLWYCAQHTRMWRRGTDRSWKIEQDLDYLRAQYTVDDALQLKSPDTSCMVHRREVLDEIGGWDEQCQWLENRDFFTRCLIRSPEGVQWIPAVLVEDRKVSGPDEVGGVSATTAQDRARKQAGWRYLVEKWRHHPGFSEAAARRRAKYPRNVSA
jgi:glycosyltransferase involved in cell wall biosynthesis